MALNFDGTDDALNFGDINALDAPSALSVAYWVQPKAGFAVNDAFFAKKASNLLGFSIQCDEATASSLEFQVQPGTTLGRLASAVVADAWAHHMWVYDGGGAANADRLKLWLNGVAQTLSFTGTIPASIPDSGTTAVRVGTSDINPSLFMPMYMANLLVWSAVLSGSEAAQQHLMRRPVRTSNLLIWCPLNDGTSAKDYSGSGNNPTLVSSPAQISGPPISFGAPVMVL